MTVKEFLYNYVGGSCVTIDGYCEEEYFDYFGGTDECDRSDDKPKCYIPAYIAKESWWNEVKDRKIKEWVLGGGLYKAELYIKLAEN